LVKIMIHMEGHLTTFQENRRNKWYGTEYGTKNKEKKNMMQQKRLESNCGELTRLTIVIIVTDSSN